MRRRISLRTSPEPATGEIEHFSDLVTNIYDTVLDTSLWPHALASAARYVDGAAASIFWNDSIHRTGGIFFHDDGIELHYLDLYFNKYVKLNPITTIRHFANADEPLSTADLIPYEEFRKSRFYREWAQPQNLVDFVSVTLDKSATSSAMFGVFRHARHGLVDETTRQRMRLLTPHLRRAVLISRALELKQAKAEAFAETLDGLRAGMLLVDANGRIMHANAAAHAILGRGDILRAIGGRVELRDPQTDASLREIFSAAALGDAAVGAKGVALPLIAENGEPHVVHALPLTSGARRRAGSSCRATAAIFVQMAAPDVPSQPQAVAEAYNLTLAEVRVLFAIVEVGGAPEVAEMFGVSHSTVKTHLGRIYAKTGAGRQADLVKIVNAFVGPLHG